MILQSVDFARIPVAIAFDIGHKHIITLLYVYDIICLCYYMFMILATTGL